MAKIYYIDNFVQSFSIYLTSYIILKKKEIKIKRKTII